MMVRSVMAKEEGMQVAVRCTGIPSFGKTAKITFVIIN